MPAPCTYDYAVIRVVPRVERGEFINVGVIVSCPALDFLEARIELDERAAARARPRRRPRRDRARTSHDSRDLRRRRRRRADRPAVARERFHWLVAPRSTIIQTSPVHTGRCRGRLGDTLEHLLERMVRNRSVRGLSGCRQ